MNKYMNTEKFRQEVQDRIEEAINWSKNADHIESKGRADQTIATLYKVINMIDDAPAADVEEVKYAEWIECPDKVNEWRCGNCGYQTGIMRLDYHFCPHCGAKMDKTVWCRECEFNRELKLTGKYDPKHEIYCEYWWASGLDSNDGCPHGRKINE